MPTREARVRERTAIARDYVRKARVAGRDFSEAPVSWAILLGGTGYGIYQMVSEKNVVSGAMVASISLLLGSKGVYG